MRHGEKTTQVFVQLPSGLLSMNELREALARLTSGVAGWSDVRVAREALELLEAYARGEK